MAKVTPHLNSNREITSWNVDINNPEKILTVETESLQQEEVKGIIEKLGFKADEITV